MTPFIYGLIIGSFLNPITILVSLLLGRYSKSLGYALFFGMLWNGIFFLGVLPNLVKDIPNFKDLPNFSGESSDNRSGFQYPDISTMPDWEFSNAIYRSASSAVVTLWRTISQEMADAFSEMQGLTPIGKEEFEKKYGMGGVILFPGNGTSVARAQMMLDEWLQDALAQALGSPTLMPQILFLPASLSTACITGTIYLLIKRRRKTLRNEAKRSSVASTAVLQ